MKKLLSLAAALLLVFAAGCSKPAEPQPGDSVDEPAAEVVNTVTSNDVTISVDSIERNESGNYTYVNFKIDNKSDRNLAALDVYMKITAEDGSEAEEVRAMNGIIAAGNAGTLKFGFDGGADTKAEITKLVFGFEEPVDETDVPEGETVEPTIETVEETVSVPLSLE